MGCNPKGTVGKIEESMEKLSKARKFCGGRWGQIEKGGGARMGSKFQPTVGGT